LSLSVMKAKVTVVKKNLDILDNVERLSEGYRLTQSSQVESILFSLKLLHKS